MRPTAWIYWQPIENYSAWGFLNADYTTGTTTWVYTKLYVFATLSAGMYTFNRPNLSTWPARLLDKELLPAANALEAGFGTLDSMLGPVAPRGVNLNERQRGLDIHAETSRQRDRMNGEDDTRRREQTEQEGEGAEGDDLCDLDGGKPPL